MNGLEAAGFVHLYGLSSVLNALQANRRDLITSQERSENDSDDGDDRWTSWNDDDEEEATEKSVNREPPRPQAQFRPYLFVQERKNEGGRRGQKSSDAEKVLALAEERGVPIAQVDKGVLNSLSENRPHQVSFAISVQSISPFLSGSNSLDFYRALCCAVGNYSLKACPASQYPMLRRLRCG